MAIHALTYEITLGALMILGAGVITGWKRRKVAAAMAPVFALQKEINALSLEEVREEVDRRLEESSNLKIVLGVSGTLALPPTASAFFSRYQSISDEDGLFHVECPAAGEADYRGYLRAGVGFCGDTLVIIEPESGETIALDVGEKPDDGVHFASIEHYLLFEFRDGLIG